MAQSGTATTLADIVAALNSTLQGMGVTNTGIGTRDEAASYRELPPAVIWVPTRDRYEAVETHMGSSLTTGPRWIKKRMAGFDVHLWAAISAPSAANQEDWSPLDDLIEKVISALQQNLPGGYELEGGQHVDADDEGEAMEFGRSYILSVYIAMPVRMQGDGLSSVVVNSTQQTDTIGNTSTTP